MKRIFGITILIAAIAIGCLWFRQGDMLHSQGALARQREQRGSQPSPGTTAAPLHAGSAPTDLSPRESSRHAANDLQKQAALVESHKQQERVAIRDCLKGMESLNGDALYDYAIHLAGLPEEFEPVYLKYQKAKQDIENLRAGGIGTAHPNMISKNHELEALRGALNEELGKYKTDLVQRLN